jgi:hypothetical protein
MEMKEEVGLIGDIKKNIIYHQCLRGWHPLHRYLKRIADEA